MPENLYDTAASYDQNQQYLKDPEHSEAKPYSTKQQAANESRKGKTMLYHKDCEKGRVFGPEEAEQALEDGWVDAPYVHPNNPTNQVEPEPVKNDEYKALVDEAEKMGIKVDARWGNKRLKDEILRAADG